MNKTRGGHICPPLEYYRKKLLNAYKVGIHNFNLSVV